MAPGNLKHESSKVIPMVEAITTLLSECEVGDWLIVKRYKPNTPELRTRLMAMGLVPGAKFKIVRMAPLGDPVEIECSGVRWMVRKKEMNIMILSPL